MSLYDRLLGNDGFVKIPVHGFQAVLCEFARGQATGQQAQTAIAAMSSGVPLDAGEVTEATTLLATITAATGTMNKINRALEINDVLMLGELGGGYTTVQAIKTRLGV